MHKHQAFFVKSITNYLFVFFLTLPLQCVKQIKTSLIDSIGRNGRGFTTSRPKALSLRESSFQMRPPLQS